MRKDFKYICIGLFVELLAVATEAKVAFMCLSLSYFPLAMLLPLGFGVLISLAVGKMHSHFRSVIFWQLMMRTVVYTIFAQILPAVAVVTAGIIWINSLPSSVGLGGVAVVWIVILGSGVAILTAVLGCVSNVLPDKKVPQSSSQKVEDIDKTEV